MNRYDEPTPIGAATSGPLYTIVARWLDQQGDRRTVDEYLADGYAGKLSGAEATPFNTVGHHL